MAKVDEPSAGGFITVRFQVSGVRFQDLEGFRCQVSGFRLSIGASEKVGRASVPAGFRPPCISEYGRHPSSLKLRRAEQRPTLLIRAVPDT